MIRAFAGLDIKHCLSACLGQVKLVLGQVKVEINLPFWASKMSVPLGISF